LTLSFLILTGMTPVELVAYLWRTPPTWVENGWTRVILLFAGLALVYGSLRFNTWSLQQEAIDDLAEDIAWAIRHLLNQRPEPISDEGVAQWERRYRAWCEKVSDKLGNRAYFTRADQLHFDRLGFVDQLAMTGHQRLDWLLGQLRLKFDRLREVLNWVQLRRR
jgi:hypothetical protein